MKNFYIMTFILLFGLQQKSFAYQEDQQLWLNLTLQGQVQKSFGVYFETQGRYSNDRNKFYEYLIRPAIYYKTDIYGSFFLGTLARLNTEYKQIEQRPWLQYLKSFQTDTFKIIIRPRYEFRDIDGLNKRAHRFRGFVRLESLNPLGSSQIKPFFFHESFINLNDVSTQIKKSYSQSRNALGVSYQLADNFIFEISYLNVIINNTKSSDQNLHTLNLVGLFNF